MQKNAMKKTGQNREFMAGKPKENILCKTVTVSF